MYTITINLFYLAAAVWAIIISFMLYIYFIDDSDDRLTHMRHDLEMKKEWFRMLTEKEKENKNVLR
jgi:hypothetical protein